LLDAIQTVAENHFDTVFNRAKDGRREISSRQADMAALCDLDKRFDRKASDPPAPVVYDFYLSNTVTPFHDFGHETHAIGDVEASGPRNR
jgi:hypothetical protein